MLGASGPILSILASVPGLRALVRPLPTAPARACTHAVSGSGSAAFKVWPGAAVDGHRARAHWHGLEPATPVNFLADEAFTLS